MLCATVNIYARSPVNGQRYAYKGVRELAAFRQFIQNVLEPSIANLDSGEALKEFVDPKSMPVLQP